MAAPASPAAPPAVLPVFPLTGSLLLPGNWLPLNVFEPRYRHLVEDATGAGGTGEEGGAEAGSRAEGRDGGGAGGWMGMIQPRVPHQDNWPALEEPPANPELYTVGCAGRIERCEPQPDGRYLVLLKGVSRFRVRGELALRHGYRRGAPAHAAVAAALPAPPGAPAPPPPPRAPRALRATGGRAHHLRGLRPR